MKLLNDRLTKPATQQALCRSIRRATLAIALVGSVTVVSVISGVTPVSAQNLNAQVERLQRELTALQRQVYRGEAPPAGATAPAGGELSGTQAARIELRLSQFESELRSLTGQVEQFGFKINQVGKRLDSLVADVDLRLQNLEQRANSGGGATSDALAGAAGATEGTTQSAAAGTAPAQQTGGAPGTLGVINQGDLQNFQNGQTTGATPAQTGNAGAGGTAQTAAAGAVPGGTPQEQYNNAFSLLRQAQYDEAEQALSSFVERNPEDPLAGNAKYWLGETYYVRGNYQQSAVIFAEAYQQYPNNSKAPDNLLKLGMSLGALGNTADACGTFAELLKRYPKAAATVQRRTKQEQQRYSCS